jgi:hypothetical protein
MPSKNSAAIRSVPPVKGKDIPELNINRVDDIGSLKVLYLIIGGGIPPPEDDTPLTDIPVNIFLLNSLAVLIIDTKIAEAIALSPVDVAEILTADIPNFITYMALFSFTSSVPPEAPYDIDTDEASLVAKR